MTNKAKLAFDLLEQEIEVLSVSENNRIMGGTDPVEGDTCVIGGVTCVWISGMWYAELNEVIITGNSSYNSSSGYTDFSWNWSNPYTGGSGSFWLSSGGYVEGSGGSTGGGGTSGGGTGTGSYDLLNTKFYSFLDATGKTASSFSSAMDTAYDISKFGDFATEAKALLKNFTDYSGVVGTTLDIVLSGIEIYADGQMTKDELVTFLTNQVAGGVIGAIPVAGGILSIIYDASGADDLLAEQIVILVNKYY